MDHELVGSLFGLVLVVLDHTLVHIHTAQIVLGILSHFPLVNLSRLVTYIMVMPLPLDLMSVVVLSGFSLFLWCHSSLVSNFF